MELILNLRSFYQGILKHMSHVSDPDKSRLKTRVRNACEKYSRIKVPYQYKKIIHNLSKNISIVILKQD